jgi:hypothetical protein
MKRIVIPILKRILLRASAASKPPWTTEYRGWGSDHDPEDPGREAVIHLNDASREWDSWGWGDLNRIIVYGTGIGQNDINGKQEKRAKANVEFMAHARADVPLLATLLQLAIEELSLIALYSDGAGKVRASRTLAEIRRALECYPG